MACILVFAGYSELAKAQGYFVSKGVEVSAGYATDAKDFSGLSYRAGLVTKKFAVGLAMGSATQGNLNIQTIGPDFYYRYPISKFTLLPWASFKSRTYSGTYNSFPATGNGTRFTAGLNFLFNIPTGSKTEIKPVLGAMWYRNDGKVVANGTNYSQAGNYTALYAALRFQVYKISLIRLGLLPEVWYGSSRFTYGLTGNLSVGFK
ncbi:MAG: hypothetical protein JNL57_10005 [Bacteroidetes bacterium]|nr:hypothetical protein [Bacteroidota bacterium]